MNTPLIRVLTALLVVAFGLAASSPAQATPIKIHAHFNGGTVDSYPGAAGDGWLTPWAHGSYGTYSGAVKADAPLNNSGRYLEVDVTRGSQYASTYRRFDSTQAAPYRKPYYVSFDIRIDALAGYEVNVIGSSTPQGNVGSEASWGVTFGSGNNGIHFLNASTGGGYGETDTGLNLVLGRVYSVHLVVTGGSKLYSAEISDGVTTFTSGVLRGRNAANQIPFLNFGTRLFSTGSASFAIDNIMIGVPEPSTALLLAPLALIGTTLAVRRRRSGSRA